MKRICAFVLTLVIIAGCLPLSALAADPDAWTGAIATGFADGTGTADDPYLITAPDQLAYLAQQVNAGNSYSGQYISLAANLNLGDVEWKPIGVTTATPFAGTFNGNGYTISHLQQTGYYSGHLHGLFGCNTGTITQLRIDAGDIDPSYAGRESAIYSSNQNSNASNKGVHIGIAVGMNKGTLSFLTVFGSTGVTYTTGQSGLYYRMHLYMGGIAGSNTGTISNCYSYLLADPNAHGQLIVGGLVGWSNGGTISGCMAEGTVETAGTDVSALAGGFVGSAQKSTITDCFSSTTVYQYYSEIVQVASGGFAAYLPATSVTRCVATGKVTAQVSYHNSSDSCIAGGFAAFVDCTTATDCVAANSAVYSLVNKGYGSPYGGKFFGYRSEQSGGPTTSLTNCYTDPDIDYKRSSASDGGCGKEDNYSISTSASYPNGNATSGQYDAALLTSLGYGAFSSVEDTLSNAAHVWRLSDSTIALFCDPDYLFSLTVRYILENGSIYRIHASYHGRGASVSVDSPEIYGAAPDKASVSRNSITSRAYEDVTYVHAHVPGDDATCHAPQICILCDEVVTPQLSHVPGAAATCTSNQTCTLCGDELNAILPHPYRSTVTPPTCTQMGYTTHTCPDCPATYTDAYVAPTGHSFDEDAQDYICTTCGMTFGRKPIQYRLTVRDIESGAGIFAAAVTLGSQTVHTDSSGVALFILTSDEDVTLSVTAEGYPDYKVSGYRVSGLPADTVYLESGDSGIFAAYCNGSDVIAGQTQLNAHAHSLTATVEVTGRAKANILRYELVQKGTVIATSTDGKFSVSNSRFRRAQEVYVRMHTDGAEGHNVFQRRLNITVVGINLQLDSDWGKLLPFSAGMTLEFPDGIPVLDGLRFAIPNLFGKDTKLAVSAGNEKIVVTVSETNKLGKPTQDVDNKTRDEIFKELVDEWVALKNSEAKKEVTGSIALVFEFNESGPTKVYGQLQVGFELSYEWGRTFVVWIIPVHARIETSLEGGFTLTDIGYDFENGKLLIPELSAQLEGKVFASIGLGCNALSAGLYGQLSAALELALLPDPGLESVSLTGELGAYVRVKLLFWKAMEYRHTLLKGTIRHPAEVYAMSALYSMDSYQTASRDYLNHRLSWMAAATYSESGSQVLQNASYGGIAPRIVRCGDTTMMLFVDDDGSSGLNYQHLYYSIYDPTAQVWGAPIRVDSNDNPDLEFDVCTDGEKIHLLYTQSCPITEENQENYEQITNSMEVYATSFNGTAFTEPVNISCNAGFDSQPRITCTDGTVSAVWVHNATGDVFSQNANNTLYAATCTDTWTAPAALTGLEATVTDLAIGHLAGKLYVAAIRDLDCDLQTSEDRVLDLVDLTGSQLRLTAQCGNYDGVTFSRQAGLSFTCDGQLLALTDPAEAPRPLLSESAQGLGGAYRILSVSDTTWAVLYTKNQDEGSDIYGIFCHDGQFGSPVRVTRTESAAYVDAFDAVMVENELLVPYLSTLATFESDTFTTTSSFRSQRTELSYDLIMQDVTFPTSQLLTGDTLQLTAAVTNNSWQTVNAVRLSLTDSNGAAVVQQTLSLPLRAGETENLTLTVDKALLTPSESYTLFVAPEGETDSNIADNSQPVSLWYTDFAVDAKQQLVPPEGLELVYSVRNDGNITGNCIIQVYKTDAYGSVTRLHMESVMGLAPNQTHTGTVPINSAFYTDGETGTVYVGIVPTSGDLYAFNDTQSLYVGGLSYNANEELDTQGDTFQSPVLDRDHVIFDPATGGDITVNVTENGCTFQGITGVDSTAYTYENGALTLHDSYLRGSTELYRYLYLTYASGEKTTEVLLVVELKDTTPAVPVLTVQAPQTVKFDAHSLVLGEDFTVSTPSTGEITTAYSTDGVSFTPGLPAAMGSYHIRLSQAADPAHNFAAGEASFTIAIVKGGRAICVPRLLGTENGQITFGDATPTAGIGDGTVLYGCSAENDPATVTNWAAQGVLPQSADLADYYIFAMVTEGSNYEAAYSLGVKAQAHVHQYGAVVVPPTCEAEGYTRHSCTCGDSYQDTFVPAAGHDPITDPATAPGCETTGLSEGSHCKICSKVLISQQVLPAAGHDPITDPAKAPGCETTGLSEGSHCKICSKVLTAQQVLPATGHTMHSAYDESNHFEQCSVCGFTRNPAAHTFDNSCDATCNGCGFTRDPVHIYTNVCDSTCNICGAHRDTSHQPGELTYNETHHSQICLKCGATLLESYHIFTNSCDATCNGCDYKRTVAHTYDDTCDPDCNVCGDIRAVSHTWSPSWRANATKHWYQCQICAMVKDAANHVYDNACDESCNTCHWRREITHSYRPALSYDADTHWQVCSTCDSIGGKSAHEYDNACDTTCNSCAYTRTTQHSYNSQWQYNTDVHWNTCVHCGASANTATHSYDNACDESCNTCGYTRRISHTFSPGWKQDETAHWYECAVCHLQISKVAHSFDNACDASCNICQYTRNVTHDYGTLWQSNLVTHWQACQLCGEASQAAAHEYDHDCDTSCNVCDAQREIFHDYAVTWDFDGENHWHSCQVCKQTADRYPHSYANDCDETCEHCDYVRTVSHVYDNTCDPVCNFCGHVRPVTHSFGDTWHADAQQHWHACQLCGITADAEAHRWKELACAICGRTKALRGDVDNNQTVNDQDAIYLLWHTLFPDGYALNQSGDMDGNGSVDDQDAIYLLWHALFPDTYPLH